MAELIDPTDQTGKMRVRRIRLDYHQDRGKYARWRWRGAIVAALILGLYLGWIGWSPAGVKHLSTGPLSRAHAALETNCQACHVDFTPIAADAWRLQPTAAARATAEKCRDCHREVGHHAVGMNELGERIDLTCAGCHQEHRGLGHNLIPRDDRGCTDCHRDTGAFRSAERSTTDPPIGNVVGFTPTGHAEFRSLVGLVGDADKGTAGRPFEFDHALHLLPGQVPAGRRGAMTLDRMAPEHRQRYRRAGQGDESIVQLACADCHDFRTDGAAGRDSDGAWGAVSQPIRYEQHCVACHPLTAPGQRQDQFGLPHGVPLDRLRELLSARAATARDPGTRTPAVRPGTATGPRSQADDRYPLLVPGRESASGRASVTSSPRGAGSTSEVTAGSIPWETLARGVERQCRVCHTTGDLDGLVGSPRTPRPRLELGRYSHATHRSVACVVCHPQADPQGATVSGPAAEAWTSWVSGLANPAKILGLESCTPCHRGSESVVTRIDASLTGGLSDLAPDRCTTCHRYHQRAVGVAEPVISGSRGAEDRAADAAPRDDRSEERSEEEEMRAAVSAPRADWTFVTTAQAVETAPSGSSGWLGQASCGASTCHGGPIRAGSLGDGVHWNASQTAFEAVDPHGRSGATLAGEWSRRIVIGLDTEAAESPERFRGVLLERCAGCHSPRELAAGNRGRTGGQASGTRGDPASGHAEGWEGVACEACHGPAADWLDEHLASSWQVRSPMRDLRKYTDRVEACVRCHVGSRREDGMVRDMNHDLIAAGHPALRFEPWSALRRLPTHGGGDRERDGLVVLDGESERRRQAIGRLIALRAALRLAAERFQDVRGGPAPLSVWPELADYDCFACHQPLRLVDVGTKPSSGYPTPHAWLQAGMLDAGLRAAFPLDAARWDAAMETFRLRTAGAGEIAAATREAEAVLDRWLKRLQEPAPLPREVAGFQPLVPAGTERSGTRGTSGIDWHHAAQWYLGAHAGLRDRASIADPQAAAQVLRRMTVLLAFEPADHGQGETWDSPARFDGRVFSEAADELTRVVEQDIAK